MNRAEGFAVMDVSTSICEDPKFRLIQRMSPQLVAPAFAAYMAVMAESWKAGKRVTIDNAWPAFLPFDSTVIDVMREVGLIDKRGVVSPKAWRDWFEPARERREKARDRWHRANDNRNADTARLPRGNSAGTSAPVPSVRSAPSAPPEPPVPSVPADRSDGSTTLLTDEEHLPPYLRVVNGV